ncbi:MAG: hypothetical protein VX777_10060 [Chlamydiota bacterium]|nr:hypothetical protein [Chlamydiota bacterium]
MVKIRTSLSCEGNSLLKNKEFRAIIKSKNPLRELKVDENGKITRKSFFGRIFCRKKANHRFANMYQNKIHALLEQINDIPEIKNFSSTLNTSSKKVKKFSRRVDRFVRRIGLLPESFFDRAKVTTHTNTNLYQFLSPNYQTLKASKASESANIEITIDNLKSTAELKKQAIADTDPKASEKKNLIDKKLHAEILSLKLKHERNLIDRKIEKNKIAIKLGMGVKGNKGANRTKLLFRVNSKGKKVLIGVYKPKQEHVPLITRIINFFKRLFFCQLHYLNNTKVSQSQAESASYLIDRFFDCNVVPPSKILGNKGGIQLSANTYLKHKAELNKSANEIDLKEAKDVLRLVNKDNFSEKETQSFQNFIIHDYLIGNLDAHDENWFIYQNNNNSDSFEEIIGIDKANSFIRKNPSKLVPAKKNQYDWRHKNIARKKFTEESLKLMSSMTPERIEDSIKFIDQKLPGFLKKEMKERYRERGAVLYKIGQSSQIDYTPVSLAHYWEDTSINNFLHPERNS